MSAQSFRVLYFAPQQVFPLNTGARLRNYHLSKYLAQRADVTLLQIRDRLEAPTPPPAGSGFSHVAIAAKDGTYTAGKVIGGILGPVPLTVRNCVSSEIADRLRSMLQTEPFDIVQIEGVHLSEYLSIIRTAPGNPRILCDWHNIESELMWRYSEMAPLLKRLVSRRTAQLLERSEQRLIDECDWHTVASERERQKLLERFPGAHIDLVPNGVDTAWVGSTPAAPLRDAIVFTGSMDYHANIDGVLWFAQNMWPELTAQFPELRFVIAGRSPARQIRQLADEKIEVTGTVDDIRPYYARARAVIVPLRIGSGTRLKILEAMAAGAPVVSTRLGAEGIEAEDGVHLLLADDPAGLIAALQRVLGAPEEFAHVTEAARQLAIERYDWAIPGEVLYQRHLQLLGRNGSRSAR